MVQSWYETGAKPMPELLKVFNVRLPEDMHADLKAMSAEQKRSVHNMVIVILQSAIDQWKKERRHEPGH